MQAVDPESAPKEPQLGIGLAEKYHTPSAGWLRIDHNELTGDQQLGEHIVGGLIERNYWPTLSYEMEPDHGFLTVYDQLDPSWSLPMVPIGLERPAIDCWPRMIGASGATGALAHL